ncbi:class I SAM-dependent methyltransferase [Tolypothrix sp. FACHB-123]|uniref:class I SAM-dependent methyltransferase n=1 Tax=Tolypothrix sp. FACHB-123 TaxID=2692868 RepID=UPI001683B1A0|nr:class I SAM-dependent methyltransferase [Tolypothrix sp. FACHB-123]MBD2357951.1 class I SAM-dependent methyltransferase [Tolypothrix sp. FACHB-123]
MEWTIGWWQISVQRVYPTNAQLSQTYNQAASWWHQHLQVLGYSHAYRELWRSLKNADMLPHSQDKLTICDCGIGTAAFSLAFAQIINPKAHITGVDISAQMLNKADQKLSLAKVPHQVYQSDVNTLPFADCAFDAVICAHTIEHLPNPLQGLREMVRVLRPGAPLIVVVTQSGLLGWLIQWYWGNRCFSQEELSMLIHEAGLTQLQFLSFPVGLARFTSIACIAFKRS